LRECFALVPVIRHTPGSAIAEQVEKQGFRATTDFALLKAMDAILICVPTPPDHHREPDLSFVRNTELKKPPLEFRIRGGDLRKSVTQNPATDCDASFNVQLGKP
jgi:hypothetical protein